jgi:hypothetical protein
MRRRCRSCLQPWVCLESVPHPGAEGKQAGKLVVEGPVNGQDGVDWRLGRLTDVSGLQVRKQPGPFRLE